MSDSASHHEDLAAAFIDAACVPLEGWHASGMLDEANAMLAAHPEIRGTSIFTAAVLGDNEAVCQFLERDPASATAKGGPRGWDALTYLCFSRYVRLDPTRWDGLARAAKALLDAGASANTGWFEMNHQPQPEWESVLYGAAGVAHHAELTRLLLEHGADPNDEETPYHAPEGYDNAALKVLVESGKLSENSLTTMLLRKADWHDVDGIRYLLDHGADPNRMTRWQLTALHQALIRDNALESIEAMLDHDANPAIKNGRDGQSSIAIAARRGRGDVLELFERRGLPMELDGLDRLIAACARNDGGMVQSIAQREPRLVQDLLDQGGTVLAEFAGNGNTLGVAHLLGLGVDVAALYMEGDGYFDVAKESTALHVAAWRARHETVRLLIERGARVEVRDGKGRTPLALAVRACVDSYWKARRTPESVAALLGAGASAKGIPLPTGYEEVDQLLRSRRSG